jgi:hypothetical protein
VVEISEMRKEVAMPNRLRQPWNRVDFANAELATFEPRFDLPLCDDLRYSEIAEDRATRAQVPHITASASIGLRALIA